MCPKIQISLKCSFVQMKILPPPPSSGPIKKEKIQKGILETRGVGVLPIYSILGGGGKNRENLQNFIKIWASKFPQKLKIQKTC